MNKNASRRCSHRRAAAFAAASFALFALAPTESLAQPKDQYAYVDRWLKGHEMTPEQALENEKKLEEKPDDMRARASLLGYYGGRMYESDEAREAVERHTVWLVENKPESYLCAEPRVDSISSAAVYEKCVALFEAHHAAKPDNAEIIANFADFVLIENNEKAIELLRKGAALEPEKPYWAERLAFAMQLNARSAAYSSSAAARMGLAGQDEAAAEKEAREAAAEALVAMEEALAMAEDSLVASSLLGEMAKTAFDAGDDEKAATYAQRLLKKDAKGALSGPPGLHGMRHRDNDAIHAAHTVLGLLALKAGDKTAAARHLAASAPSGSSPVLGSFGPSMRLAKAMIEAGERDAVLDYFERCSKFWESGRDDLEEWTRMVKAGLAPSRNDHRWQLQASR